jgi:uncharacterized protein involved in type VI secretion and phage assembly
MNRHTRPYTAPPFHGVAEGTVIKNDLPRGHVLVKLRSLAGKRSLKCRVLQPYAGDGFGTFFIPEVGSEVLVACTHGDLRLPVVLGGLWNGEDKVPAERTQDQDPKLLKTKGGHQILLDDSANAQKITIVDSGGRNRIVIDTAGDSITIETGGTLRLRASDIEIEAQGNLNLKGFTINLN